jgi:hypothetical protein
MYKTLTGLILLVLAACSNGPAGPGQPAPLGPPVAMPSGAGLSADQIRQQLVGNTGTGPISGSIAMMSMYLGADGAALAKLPTGLDQGRWRISNDNLLCTTWTNYRQGQEYCQRVYRDGDVYKLVNSTSIEEFRFVAGKTI